MPSSKALARTMARYVDPQSNGPVIELGPGTGPVTEALVQRGVDPARLIFGRIQSGLLPAVAHALSGGDRRAGRRLSAAPLAGDFCARAGRRGGVGIAAGHQAAAHALAPDFGCDGPAGAGAPFIQFTYAMVPPIPKALSGIKAEPSELIWLNLPPARVWVYRGR